MKNKQKSGQLVGFIKVPPLVSTSHAHAMVHGTEVSYRDLDSNLLS